VQLSAFQELCYKDLAGKKANAPDI